jgi:ppGpp synthetase/RelA/SpoT-type nucleotidyltranferase
MNPSLDRLARDIGRDIEFELQRIGVYYRIFIRAKSESSINRKLSYKQYDKSPENKLMQDIIGIRITVYFNDDLPIIYNALKTKLNFDSESIDEDEETVFKPTRTNLIFRMDEERAKETYDSVIYKYTYIDTTYEVQLRTVLSEGWHEVDHDLRYKCKNDWQEHLDISRTFNGVYASLVTSDWSIITIFEKLAYRHYKLKNWEAMLRNKFRLRFIEEGIDERIVEILTNNPEVAKDIFRVERSELMNKIFIDGIRVPLTLSNMVFILNAYFLHNSDIIGITPDFILSNKKLFNNRR